MTLSKKTLVFLLIATIAGSGLFSYRAFAGVIDSLSSAFNFGGFVTSAIPCPCSNSWLLKISPPKGGLFLFFNGTPQFAYRQLPRPGVWTLGLYKPGGRCRVPATHGCKTIGLPKGTITSIVGTSF